MLVHAIQDSRTVLLNRFATAVVEPPPGPWLMPVRTRSWYQWWVMTSPAPSHFQTPVSPVRPTP